MRKSALILFSLCLTFLASSVWAQDTPSMELFGGFSYNRIYQTNNIGWSISGVKNLGEFLGIEVDLARFGNSDRVDYAANAYYKSKEHTYTIMAGPHIGSRGVGKLAPYIHLLLGAAMERGRYDFYQDGSLVDSSEGKYNNFIMLFGGGIDREWRGPVALRVIQIDYQGIRTQGYWFKGWRLSTGLVLRLGRVY